MLIESLSPMESPPQISIIIPTFNRPEQLKRNLQSIVQLDIDRETFEVLVVDDGSIISNEPVIAEISSNINCIFIWQENRGPAAARNRGAKAAKGKYLVFLDDDCTLPPDWAKKTIPNLHNDIMVGGYSNNMLKDSVFSSASQCLTDYLYSYYNSDHTHSTFITSNNMIVPKRLFWKTGGFSTDFSKAAAEDRDFCDKWLWNRFKIHYFPEIIVEHWHKMTLSQFLRQHFNYGCGAKTFRDQRLSRNSKSTPVEPFSFYFNLIFFPFRNQKNANSILLCFCLILSQICNAGGFFFAEYGPNCKSTKRHL